MKVLPLLVLFWFAFKTNAQQNTVTAKIVDSQNNIPVSQVLVKNLTTGEETYSNSSGFFRLIKLEADSLELLHPSYNDTKIVLPKEPSFTIIIERNYTSLGVLSLNTSGYSFDTVMAEAFDERIFLSENYTMAHYKNSVKDIYAEIFKGIKNKTTENIPVLYEGNLLISINPQGVMSEIFIEDQADSYQLIKTLKNFEFWSPTIINGLPTWQHYYLKIKPSLDNLDNTLAEYALIEYLKKSIFYPPLARGMGIGGTVYVIFKIEKGTDSITGIEVLNDQHGAFSNIVLQTVKSIPAYIKNSISDSLYIIPVNFAYPNEESKVTNLPLGKMLRKIEIN